jgi:MFS family permease
VLTQERELRDNNALMILALAVVSSALTGPGQTVGVAVFNDHIVDGLDLSREAVAAAYMVGTLTSATMLPFVGRFIDRFGVRLSQMIIGVVFTLALLNMSQINGWVWLTIGFLGIRFAGQGSLSLVSTVTVSLRFLADRGTAIGIFSTASNALMLTVPLGLAFVISQVGWRKAWVVAAAVIAVTVLPIAWFGLGSMPTNSAKPAAIPGDIVVVDDDFTREEAIRTKSFWIIASVSATAGMLGTALNFHQIDLLGEVGLSDAEAAAMFVPQIIGSSVAGLAFGYMADRVGTRFLPAAGMLLLVFALLLAAVVAPGAIVLVYAIVLGAMGSAVRTVTATMLPAFFGTSHLGAIQGFLTLISVAGSAMGPVVLAVVEGSFGAYRPAVLLLSIIPGLVMFFSLRRDPNLRPLSATTIRY